MTEALKELFDAYKHLPVGVMFFKDQKLFFVNDHLRTILLLQNLETDDVIRIIADMVGLENATHESLCDFFASNDYFLYRDRHLQIDREHYENIDIFVIIRINDASIRTIDETHPLRLMHQTQTLSVSKLPENEQLILTKALGSWDKIKLPSIVIYKGIPIKGDCTIVHTHEGEIAIKVEKKQLPAAQIGMQWLIGSRRDKMISGEIIKYDLTESIIWLKNLTIISDGFHLRQVIRYAASPQDQISISINGKKYLSELRDISEQGLSIQSDNGAFLLALSSQKVKTLDAELILPNAKIAVQAVWLYTIALESGTQMKIAFRIGYDLHNGSLLREWLNLKQLQLIKEVRAFVQMIPPPQKKNTAEWVI